VLKSNKPLQVKTTLKAKAKLQANKKPKKQTKPTITKVKKDAIIWFNRAVKYRDSDYIEQEWLFVCITCPRRVLFRDRDGQFYKTAHAGHFMPCHKENTRFNELNVNGQCASCNYNQGEQYQYAKALELKYGDGTADELTKLSKVRKQWTVPELEEIIKEYRSQCEWYEKQAQTR